MYLIIYPVTVFKRVNNNHLLSTIIFRIGANTIFY